MSYDLQKELVLQKEQLTNGVLQKEQLTNGVLQKEQLTSEQLEEIEEICQRWLFSVNQQASLEQVYQGLIEIDFSSVINAFTKRLEKIDYTFTKSEQVSGAICFYGSVFVSLLNTGKIEHIEHLFTFALCYMLVDHFLDDINNSETDKELIMKQLQEFIMGNDDSDKNSDNVLIRAAGQRYQEMIKSRPGVQAEIISLFRAEWKGHEISKTKELERADYYDIAWKKGAGTAKSIAAIIGLDLQVNDHLGALIQLVDDCLDVQDDTDLDIYTLARWDLENSNWDKYIYNTVLEISKLSKVYNFFKPVLLMGLVLSVHDNPGSVSSRLDQILKQYDLFGEYNKNSLNEWFHNKLFNYIQNKQNDL